MILLIDLGYSMKILVTGGAGFIGSNFVKYVLEHKFEEKMREEEGRDMIKEAIIHEKPAVRRFEEVGGRPLGAVSFKKDKITF